ncbi:MAG: response regulator transcription factor [Dehalococcoidales bacterium]|nr:response regulator transcription factor [Dehalococcoidales bacterium]
MNPMSTDTGSKNSNLKKIRIVLVDDHPLMRQAIRMWVEKNQDMEIVAEASDGKEAIEITTMLQPDIVIMDISMPKVNGLEATRQIVSRCPGTEVLAMTVHTDIEHIHGMLQAGASGYLTKNASGENVVHAVRAIYAGENVLPPLDTQNSPGSWEDTEHYHPDKLNVLTPRELKVLKYVANGLTNKDIALRLDLSLRSIKSILTSIFIKLGAASRTEAISIGLKSGILTLKDLKTEQV